MLPNTYAYLKPETLEEALQLMAKPGALALAGGTDVVLMLRDEKMEPELVVDIKSVAQMRGIEQREGALWIGAAEPLQDVVEHALVRPYRALVEGGGVVGCYEIRHRATIGGNICNGSPSADSVPGLLVHNASVQLASAAGERTLPLRDFLLGPGKVDLRSGELMAGILLPPVDAGGQSRYYRRSRVKGMDLSGLSVAVYCNGKKDYRIALGAVWPTVARAEKAEDVLNSGAYSPELLNKAVQAILQDVSPRKGSLRATPEYKKAMIGVLIEQGFNDILGGQ